ncbi:MAG: glycosyltransferase family 2 protein [Magnetococcales bacterium]|nr:glycosyltransferase family 2 protein [Magnetococcales bacterium]
MQEAPPISLLVPTRGRTDELRRLLDSLAGQDHPRLEVVIADNNDPGQTIEALVEPYRERLAIHHFRSRTGISQARNDGLPCLRGEVVAFPDDDCWYPPDLLSRVARLLRDHPGWDGISGQIMDAEGSRFHGLPGRWPTWITPINFLDRGCSFTFFFRRHVIETVGRFDETLGVGAGTPWGSGEESDFLLRALECGFAIRYCPEIRVHHPDKELIYGPEMYRRAFSYGCGLGRLLRKHALPLWFVHSWFLRAMIGVLLGVLSGNLSRVRYHVAVLRGRWAGWRDATPFQDQGGGVSGIDSDNGTSFPP